MHFWAFAPGALVLLPSLVAAASALRADDATLDRAFRDEVQPFLQTYCLDCHGAEKPKADFDLSPFTSYASVVEGQAHWMLALDLLETEEMPPTKAKHHPTAEQRSGVLQWIDAMRKNEAEKHRGDPGLVLARRLSSAEYDYTIHDLTGADIRPTKEFPVDPANQAGFDNSGESLMMSPALLNKYLQAARTVAEHLVLKPEGFTFASHPVVADTDRDKWGVLRIVDFYRQQPTDYADYFLAAWRYQHRAVLGRPQGSLKDLAADAKISARYLETVWTVLTDSTETVGPIARLQHLWRELPAPTSLEAEAAARIQSERIRDFVVQLRSKIVPTVPNLTARPIQNGSQTLVMWKNYQMAANRRKYDPSALQVPGEAARETVAAPAVAAPEPVAYTAALTPAAPPRPVQNEAHILRGGFFLEAALTTTGSSATSQMAAGKNRENDPDLLIPADPASRALYEAAFARFSATFPDAFYITERARVYMDAEREQRNAGRLLSAGLHSMTGYFRDDGPLYDLILDDEGRRELDRLWQEFEFASHVPMRMHTSFVWFERTDSSFMRDPEFDSYRPEDKTVLTQEKIKSLAGLYLAKARANNASEVVQQAIQDHFDRVAANVLRVEQERLASESSHLDALEDFAARAYRRPLTADEKSGLRAFHRRSREENGVDHEEAIRDGVVAVLMSPHFCYRIDLAEVGGAFASTPSESAATNNALPLRPGILPLSDSALASRLSYFLWSSLPDAELLALAAAGELKRPQVLAAQARRMLKDRRVRNFATEFGANWLDFRRFEQHNSVDRERFPAFDHELRQAMFEEPIRFFVDLIQEGRPVLNFLYADYTFVNPVLARHYGMPVEGGNASNWRRVDNAGRFERGGLLPMSVFLTANSPGLRTSPVKRGYWVARRVLGERIPPPPPEVPDLPNDEKDLGDLTLRQTLARHREDPSCASCHARFDSFGLVFEGYGAIGEARKVDFGGRPVDTSAEFPGGSERSGLDGLRSYVRDHRQDDFIDNLCRKLLAYALGRTLQVSDDELVDAMRTRLTADGYSFSSLVEAIVTSPQFRTKRAPALASNAVSFVPPQP